MSKSVLLITLSLLLTACQPSSSDAADNPKNSDIAPESTNAISAVKRARSKHFMAVTAHPLATDAAYNILKQGGSAADAAIAAQLVLGLVEPQSSGIGGGGFMLHWNQQQKHLQFFDGRETAPANVNNQHFMRNPQQTMGFFEALIGGHAVGAPGLVHLLENVHKQQGKLAWQDLFQPAIQLAEQGFRLSERLHYSLAKTPKVATHPAIKDYFFNEGKPKPIGSLLKNPAYANSLRLIAEQGSKGFYYGELAEKIIAAIQNDPIKPGKLSLSDLHNYQSLERAAVCGPYKGYSVCSAAPPSSGITVLQILGILDNITTPILKPNSAATIHHFAEASKLAFADRDTYIADPDFVNVATQDLLNPSYLKQRSTLITQKSASQQAQPGKLSAHYHSAKSPELPSTTHFSIIDSDGNAVSMTSSIEMGFGSRILVGGFLLNNQLTDFSFTPKNKKQQLIANRIEPGKRPRSSMSPTIVFNDNKPVMLIGSPGGSRIIDYVAKTLFYTLNGDLDIAEAIASPHIVHMNRKLELESTGFDTARLETLQQLGHTVQQRDLNSGLHGIWIDNSGLIGGADTRREGTIRGE